MNCLSRVLLCVWAVGTGTAVSASPLSAVGVEFQLLGWGDDQATALLPSAVGVKPSEVLPATGDWLVFTEDDAPLSAGFNPDGAISHNIVDLTGVGGPGFNQAPSLSGSLTMDFISNGPDSWDVAVSALTYSGWATPVMTMNQFLVTPGSPATQNPAFNVDGIGNNGNWSASPGSNWAFTMALDFYLATNITGDPSAIAATFNDAMQYGYLIPVEQLTPAALAGVTFDDPFGFHAGSLEQYLLDQIAPRLPGDATYLLISRMAKTNPVYTEPGLPITTGSLIGNMTIAYTSQVIPEPVSIMFAAAGLALVMKRRTRSNDQTDGT